MKHFDQYQHNERGFSLLELLVVLSIIAVLSIVVVVVVNPSEALKKSRDSQRMNDLESISKAISAYIATAASSKLSVDQCFVDTVAVTTYAQILYGLNSAAAPATIDIQEGTDVSSGVVFNNQPYSFLGSATYLQETTGDGWIPINFTAIPGGSPLDRLPLDPVNSVSDASSPTNQDFVYRYACQEQAANGKPSYIFELDAVLESKQFRQTDNKMANDGGDNDNYYETGSSLKLIGTGTNF